MGVTIGTYGDNGPGGWTSFTIASGRLIYIASAGSGGSDSNDGLTTATPVLTIAHAITLSTPGNGDWFLFKRGDTWTNEIFGNMNIHGASASDPLLISCYDPIFPGVADPSGSSLPRPILRTNGSIAASVLQATGGATGGDFTAIVGIEFYSYTRDPNGGNFSLSDANLDPEPTTFQKPVTWFLIEDCKFSFYSGNIDFNAQSNAASSIIYIRRSVIVDCYSLDAHSEGIFIGYSVAGQGVQNLVIEENIIDSNGWNPTLATPASVTITQASPGVVTWTGNNLANNSQIYLNSSGGGITAGTIYFVVNLSGNTFNVALTASGTPINTSAGLVSPQTATWINPSRSIFNRNVYLNQALGANIIFRGNICTNSASEGVQLRTGGQCYNNLFDTNPIGINIGSTDSPPASATVAAATVNDNVVLHSNDIDAYNNRGYGISTTNCNGSGVRITSNIIAHVSSQAAFGIGIFLDSLTSNTVASPGNIVFQWDNPITDNGSGNNTAGNTLDSSGSNTGPPPEPFPAPARTTASYNSMLGGTGTLAAFLTQARLQAKNNWRPDYTADAVIDYIQGGFGMFESAPILIAQACL